VVSKPHAQGTGPGNEGRHATLHRRECSRKLLIIKDLVEAAGIEPESWDKSPWAGATQVASFPSSRQKWAFPALTDSAGTRSAGRPGVGSGLILDTLHGCIVPEVTPVFPTFRATETMTAAEQARLLRVTAAHNDPRDHTLYSMALGTGLRLRELLGLNVGDVSPDGRQVRRRVVLNPATTKGGRGGEVCLPSRLMTKLRRFLAWKRRVGQPMFLDAPLFLSAHRRRLSPREAQWRFHWWQERTGFDRRYGFHSLRHSAVTNVYRTSRDLFLAQRFARHASPLTTVVYTHPSNEEMYKRIRNLFC